VHTLSGEGPQTKIKVLFAGHRQNTILFEGIQFDEALLLRINLLSRLQSVSIQRFLRIGGLH
jgi:hypothetical protein